MGIVIDSLQAKHQIPLLSHYVYIRWTCNYLIDPFRALLDVTDQLDASP